MVRNWERPVLEAPASARDVQAEEVQGSVMASTPGGSSINERLAGTGETFRLDQIGTPRMVKSANGECEDFQRLSLQDV